MKNVIKILYVLLLFGLPIQSSDDAKILDNKQYNKKANGYKYKLTPEEIASCRAIKAQVLNETGDKELAQKAYKRAYESSGQYKLYRKNYSQNYRNSQQNKRVGQADQEKPLSKKINPRKKHKTIVLQQNDPTLAKPNVPIVLNEQLIDTLPMNNDLDNYDFDNFFDDYEFSAQNEEYLNDEQSAQIDMNERKRPNSLFSLSNKKLNEIWYHPSVLSLTPEQIGKKPLDLSPDSVSKK